MSKIDPLLPRKRLWATRYLLQYAFNHDFDCKGMRVDSIVYACAQDLGISLGGIECRNERLFIVGRKIKSMGYRPYIRRTPGGSEKEARARTSDQPWAKNYFRKMPPTGSADDIAAFLMGDDDARPRYYNIEREAL